MTDKNPFGPGSIIDHDDPRYLAAERRLEERTTRFASNGNGPDQEPFELPELYAYKARPLEQIPRRQWLHAKHYIRQFLVMTVGPGGWGKTALLLCNTIEMVLGRGLLGPPPPQRLRICYWNGEDPPDEIERRIGALCLHYKIDNKELEGWLFLGNKVKSRQRLARLDRASNVVINQPVLEHIEAFIRDNKIDVLIIDPLLPFHRIPEAKNELMEDMLAQTFSAMVEKYNCCIELSHHTRKSNASGAGELSVDDSRGGGSVTNAARSVRVINRMNKTEAKLPNIMADDRRYYLRVDRGKPNMAPAGKATWVHLVGVEIPNGPPGFGDNIQVTEPWEYPSAFANVTGAHMQAVRELVRREPDWRKDSRSGANWIGVAIAKILELDAIDDRSQINQIIDKWLENGVIAVQERNDKYRKPREYIVLGNWNEPVAPVDDLELAH